MHTHRIVNGRRVDLTRDEVAEIEADEARRAAKATAQEADATKAVARDAAARAYLDEQMARRAGDADAPQEVLDWARL